MIQLASGDDDLPKRENIGEKRRKYDHRVLARSGAGSLDDDDTGDGDRAVRARPSEAGAKTDLGQVESEDEFYKEVKRQRLTKLSAKAALYARHASGGKIFEFWAHGSPNFFALETGGVAVPSDQLCFFV